MKRVFVSMLLTLTAIVCFTQTVGDAIYFYRNDGNINVFFRENIDSITYSNYDADSVYYDNIITQLVYTADSIYRIPLAVIDSVSFINPEIILKPDVVVMTESMLDYLIGKDEMTLTFTSDMPQSLRPQTGNVLIAYTPDNTILGEGFAGRVSEVKSVGENIQVVCDNLNDLTDIFEQLITIQQFRETSNNTRVDNNWKSEPIPISINTSYSFEDKEHTDISCSISAGIEGEYQASLVYIITLGTQFFDFKIEHNWKYANHYTYKVNKEFEIEGDEHKLASKKIYVPIPLPLIVLYFPIAELGFSWKFFMKGEASAEMDYAMSSPTHSYLTQITKDGKGFSGKNEIIKNDEEESKITFENSFSFNGSLGGGIKVGITATPPSFGKFKIPICAEADLAIGPKISGNFIINNQDNFYETFKDSKVTLCPINIDAELYGYIGEKKPDKPIPTLSVPFPLYYEWYLLPEFEDLNVTTNDENKTANITVKPKRDLVLSVPVGIGIFDSDNNLVKAKYESNEYRREDQNMTISQSFSSLSDDTTYVARPILSIFNKITPATPTKEFKFKKGQPQGDNPSNPDEPTPGKMVDLGLSVKWAGWDLGANSPEVKGDYYAWGETFTKSEYTSENYTLLDGERLGWGYSEPGFGGRVFRIACCWIGEQTDDGPDITGTEYDAAHVIWGGDWRMPTKAEAEELCSMCTKKRITYKGVDGVLFTGPNGNKIFLPIMNERNYWTSTFGSSLAGAHQAYTLYYKAKRITVDNYKGNVYFDCRIRAVSGNKEKEVCAFFEAPEDWDNTIYCWAWSESPEENFTGGTWPGVPCELVGTAENGNNIWKWTWDGNKQNGTTATQPEMIIFNNNGQPQTLDMEFKPDGYYNDYIIIDRTPSEPLYPDCCTYDEGEVCAFFESPDTWDDTIHCWAWTDTDNFTGGSWPGVSCELVGTANNGNKIWKWTWDGRTQFGTDATQPSMIIFNNNNQPQTQNMPFTLYGYYTIDGYQGVIPK